MKKDYQSTINVYKKLGVRYLRATSKMAPKDRSMFIRRLAKGAKVLDVGCIGGRDSKAFSKKGFKVTGIDVVDLFLKEAEKSVPKARFLKMDVTRMRFPGRYFDAVWAESVLLHVNKKDMPKVMNDFYRILKPGGILHVKVKYGKGRKSVSERLSGYNKRLFTFYTKTEMEKFIERAGFRVIYSKFLEDELGRKGVKWVVVVGKK